MKTEQLVSWSDMTDT